MRAALPTLFFAALASCAPPAAPALPAPAPAPVAPPSEPVVVAAPAEPPAAPPAPWGLVYRRSCHHSITPPILALDGASIASCGALFSIERGQFQGLVPFGLLAFLPASRALVEDFGGNGSVAVVDPARAEPVHANGGRLHRVAVSADRTRAVSLEGDTSGKEERVLVVRELPSLREIRRTSLGPGPDSDTAVGFLADGREVVFAPYPCVVEDCSETRTRKRDRKHTCRMPRCQDPTLLVADGGRVAPLAPSLDGLRRAAIGPGGDRAVVVRKDGSSAIVALPSGHELSRLPWRKDVDVSALALSTAGDRAALAADGVLSVMARSGGDFVEVLSDKRTFTRSLTFSADGRTLFAGDDLSAYREGAAPRVLPEPTLTVSLPPGFTKIPKRGESFVWDQGESAAPLGAVAMYRDGKHGAEVVIATIDPDEIDPAGDVHAWGQRVVERLFPRMAFNEPKVHDGPRFEAWGDAGSRAVEVHFTSDGCDPMEHFVRIQERDGHIWTVRLQTAPGLTGKRLTAWRDAFIDGPFGRPPVKPAQKPRKKGGKRRGKIR